jgi:hypothetical protein
MWGGSRTSGPTASSTWRRMIIRIFQASRTPRQLGVDVSEAAARLENSNPVDIAEYEYLSGKPAPLTRSLGVGRRVMAFLVITVTVLAAGVMFVWHMLNYYNRIDDVSQLGKDQQALHAAQASPSAAVAAATPVPTPEPEVRKAEAIVPVASAAPAVPAAPAETEITLHPVKKTWVKIQKDSDDSPPIYEDWLYPDANGLTLRGGKYWIQLGTTDGVEIRKNGQLVPYNSPGIIVE